MTDFRNRYGAWALITGASSGLGAEFARQLAAEKLDLILVARRRDRLNELATALKVEHGIQVKVVPLDLGKPNFMAVLKKQTAKLNIGLVINNAGFGIAGEFTENDLEREVAMLDVNCRAPLIIAHEFGRAMASHRRGGIIMVSSVVSFQGVPYMSHYAATKAYDLLLGEGLHYELKKHKVDVLTLCPGATQTEFANVADTGPVPGSMPVGPVVTAALEALGKKSVVVAGFKNKLMVFSTRLVSRGIGTYIAAQVMKKIGRS
ncbi:SDR family NAD(P)-dependent oxidoreductase [Turneriella parva]|uniref:Short-chain dehydrogenase/reductase SDR n=1 Tax=Turneriella parva (strain ATCC BAA-1111 / DSM 21527 / NCTC 11395 / H) TaxID=869212 RepID=I4BBG7_TURPD|nr:SDR family oxidoreductase [Turneriella parva]AFM14624.1 short-chain dehydrogenase/reductase SDR [Turneriella parva DSM 21527]